MTGPIVKFELNYYVRGQRSDEATLVRLRTAFERAGIEVTKPTRYIAPLLFAALEKALGRQFKGEGIGPRRGAWAPLAPKYAEWKSAPSGDKPILERTGNMKAALTSPICHSPCAAFDDASLKFGTRGLQYPNYHQLGTQTREGHHKMVDRPLFDFDDKADRAIKGAVLQGVRQAVKAAGVGEFARIKDDEQEE